MLRNLINALSALMLAFAVIATIVRPFEWPLLLGAGLFALGCLFERWRYARTAPVPPTGDGWAETDERFVDPETGRLVAVWYNAASGERRYVDAG